MDAMVALLDAGLSGLRSTPSPGDAHLSGEPSPVDVHTNPVSTRLSYGPPTAVETPASGPSHAAPMLLPTISLSPAAHSAEVRAALDMAAASAEAARLHAIIKDLEHDKMVAAIITEHDKVVAAQAADNSQLRRDMEHMHAIHEQRAQYELEAALMQSRLAATPITLPPPHWP